MALAPECSPSYIENKKADSRCLFLLCECVCMWRGAYLCMYVWRSAATMGCPLLFTLPPFLAQGLSLNLEIIDIVGLASEP